MIELTYPVAMAPEWRSLPEAVRSSVLKALSRGGRGALMVATPGHATVIAHVRGSAPTPRPAPRASTPARAPAPAARVTPPRTPAAAPKPTPVAWGSRAHIEALGVVARDIPARSEWALDQLDEIRVEANKRIIAAGGNPVGSVLPRAEAASMAERMGVTRTASPEIESTPYKLRFGGDSEHRRLVDGAEDLVARNRQMATVMGTEPNDVSTVHNEPHRQTFGGSR